MTLISYWGAVNKPRLWKRCLTSPPTTELPDVSSADGLRVVGCFNADVIFRRFSLLVSIQSEIREDEREALELMRDGAFALLYFTLFKVQ